MKVRLILAATAALSLVGCGAQTTSGTPAADTATSSAAPTAAPATSSEAAGASAGAPVAGAKPSRAFVVGKWGTDGDCELAIDLRPDGTSDGPFGNWAYEDGVISFPDDPEFKVSVTVVDENTMTSTNSSSEKTSTMTRCP